MLEKEERRGDDLARTSAKRGTRKDKEILFLISKGRNEGVERGPSQIQHWGSSEL